jgi:hypothetical protein
MTWRDRHFMFPRRANERIKQDKRKCKKIATHFRWWHRLYILGIFLFVCFFVYCWSIGSLCTVASAGVSYIIPKVLARPTLAQWISSPSRSRYIVYDIVTHTTKTNLIRHNCKARTSAVCVRIGAQLWSLRKTRMKNDDVVYAFLCVIT